MKAPTRTIGFNETLDKLFYNQISDWFYKYGFRKFINHPSSQEFIGFFYQI